MIHFWVLLQKSRMLNSWVKAPNCIVEPGVFPSYPSLHLSLTRLSLGNLCQMLKFAELRFLGTQQYGNVRSRMYQTQPQAAILPGSLLAVRINCPFTERKKTTHQIN